MRKAINATIGIAVFYCVLAGICAAGPFGFGDTENTPVAGGKTAWGSGVPATGTWPSQIPSPGGRAETASSKNPFTRAWTALRKKPQHGQSPELRQAELTRHDPISLANSPTAPTPDLLIATAKLSERRGNIETARQQFHQGLTAAPMHLDGLLAFARMEDRQGNMQTAERLYRQAVGINPQNPTALNDLALCLARQGNLQQSADTLQKAIDLLPRKALYRNNIATVLVELRLERDALAQLTSVHGPAVANFNVGQLLAQRGRTEEAVAYLSTALQMDPQFSAAQVALAALLGSQSENAHVASQPSQTPHVIPQTVPQPPSFNRPVERPGFPPVTNRPTMPPIAAPSPSSAAASMPPAGPPQVARPPVSTAWGTGVSPVRQLPPMR